MIASLSAIDFTSDIVRLTEKFTGRQWVFDEIDRWLKESEERFFILTGEPGMGKSAIAPISLFTSSNYAKSRVTRRRPESFLRIQQLTRLAMPN
jgi:hypothetical protein